MHRYPCRRLKKKNPCCSNIYQAINYKHIYVIAKRCKLHIMTAKMKVYYIYFKVWPCQNTISFIQLWVNRNILKAYQWVRVATQSDIMLTNYVWGIQLFHKSFKFMKLHFHRYITCFCPPFIMRHCVSKDFDVFESVDQMIRRYLGLYLLMNCLETHVR